MSVRSASSASTSIPFRLIAAIRRLPFVVRLDRTIQSKGKASTPKWRATHIKRIRPSSWYPVTAGILRLGGAPFDKSIVPCGIDLPPQLSRSGGRASTSFLKVVKEQGSRRSHQSLELERLQHSSLSLPSQARRRCRQGNDRPGDLPAPKADRRFTQLDPRCKTVTAGLCVFSATLRRNLRAGKPKSSTAASPLVDSQAL